MKTAIALGSNLGDRRSHIEFAIARLHELLAKLRVSPIIETEPVDVTDDQPPYLNAVVVGETELEPEALLERLMAIEQARGRERRTPKAARTLDLDIILYGETRMRTPTLEIPHPRFANRPFVLEPLRELEPEWVGRMLAN